MIIRINFRKNELMTNICHLFVTGKQILISEKEIHQKDWLNQLFSEKNIETLIIDEVKSFKKMIKWWKTAKPIIRGPFDKELQLKLPPNLILIKRCAK